MNWKKIVFIATISIIFIYYSTLFFQLITENFYFHQQRKYNVNQVINIINDSSIKKILLWNSMFGNRNFYFNLENNVKNCPQLNERKKCLFTYNRNLMREELFDSILFHGINDLEYNDLPIERLYFQHYIFVSLESPANRQVLELFPKDYFNLTMTYSFNSDIFWPYSTVVNRTSQVIIAPSLAVNWNTTYEDKEDDEIVKKAVRGKINTIVWFRSNCNTKSGRENYVQDLEKFIKVDKIGNCQFTDKYCSKRQNCFADIVEPNYFFYLSFENSFCHDYVTEKFFTALQYNVVPIVYGAANYTNFAPPNSYINALDFESPKELANYLLNLKEKHSEYVKYFRWKKYYEIQTSNDNVMCDLCRLVHETSNITKIYKNIFAWYSSERQCPIQEKLARQIEAGGEHYVTKKTINYNFR